MELDLELDVLSVSEAGGSESRRLGSEKSDESGDSGSGVLESEGELGRVGVGVGGIMANHTVGVRAQTVNPFRPGASSVPEV